MKSPVAFASSLVLAALMAGSVHAAEAAAPFKPDLARGQAIAVTCGACHTNDGTRGLATYPILQGQHPEYLVKQPKPNSSMRGRRPCGRSRLR